MKYAFLILAVLMMSMISCKSSKDTLEEEVVTEARGERNGKRGGKGNMEEMFAKMDADGDSRLTKLEVKGPLAEKFDSIDTDGDGYITMEEMKNAPRPKRGNRGPR